MVSKTPKKSAMAMLIAITKPVSLCTVFFVGQVTFLISALDSLKYLRACLNIFFPFLKALGGFSLHREYIVVNLFCQYTSWHYPKQRASYDELFSFEHPHTKATPNPNARPRAQFAFLSSGQRSK